MAKQGPRPQRPPDSLANITGPAEHSERARMVLFATVFGTGAAVMVIEILGTRIIAPVFGVNLFIWSALLAVTLCALALGYYIGGIWVDRAPSRRLLGVVIVGAGVLMALTLPTRRPVLLLAEGCGSRVGPLLSASLLFGPALLMLGMVGPIAVRLATDDLRTTGRRVGGMYAVSTAGSLVGTLITGFLLIPAFETNQIMIGTAVVVGVLGAVPLLIRRQSVGLVALGIPFLALITPGASLPAGIEIRAHSQSLYGLLQVIDDGNRGVRFLRADHSVIGAEWLADGTSAFSFVHLLEAVRFMRPQAKRMLQIGLGTGALPKALGPHGIAVDVVEIDPEVVRLATEHFGFSTKGEIFVEDARTLLRRVPSGSYDLLVHDTFTGGTTPEHLMSVEVLARARALLRSGGLLTLNFPGFQRGPHADATWAIMRSLQAVFSHVRAFRDLPVDESPDATSNIVFFASDDPIQFSVPADAVFENKSCERALRSFTEWEILQSLPPGPVITDSHNPLGRMQLATAADHFALMKQLLPVQVWLN